MNRGFFFISAVDHRGRAHDRAQQIGHRNTGSGIAVVNGHNFHLYSPVFCSLPALYHISQKTGKIYIKNAKNLLTSCNPCGRMILPVKRGSFFALFFGRGEYHVVSVFAKFST